jgi:hypothetical protein
MLDFEKAKEPIQNVVKLLIGMERHMPFLFFYYRNVCVALLDTLITPVHLTTIPRTGKKNAVVHVYSSA